MAKRFRNEALIRKLEAKGRGGDNRLVHISDEELSILEYLAGGGSINPETGLPELIKLKKLLKSIAAPVAAIAAPWAVPALAGALGVGTGVAGALYGGGVGALTGGSKGAIQGALLGGLSGAFLPDVAGMGAGAGGFGGGLGTELAFSAPELAGTMGLGSLASGATAFPVSDPYAGLTGQAIYETGAYTPGGVGGRSTSGMGAWTGALENIIRAPISAVSNIFGGGGASGIPPASPEVMAEIAGTPGAAGLIRAAPGMVGTAAGTPWSTATSIGQLLLGGYGLTQARQVQEAANRAAATQDPFGPYRGQYAQQLSSLMADPSSITGVPGFDAGQLALKRSLAAQGYLPATMKIPGNYMDAMSRYGGDFFDKEVQRLAALAGVNIPPRGGDLAYAGAADASMMNIQALRNLIAGTRGLVP